MAKGLRSKTQRRNRSILRKTIMEPIITNRVMKLAEEQAKIIQQNKQLSLGSLKQTLSIGNFESSMSIETTVEADEPDNNMNIEKSQISSKKSRRVKNNKV